MKKRTVISMVSYAAVICAGIVMIPRFFNRAPEQAAGREVTYEGIELSAPLYTSAPGDNVIRNRYVSVDASNASQGYVMVRYMGGSEDNPIMKISHGESEYIYTLRGEEAFPLNCGDGNYAIKIYQRQPGGKYKAVLNKNLSVELDNQLLPYLYPSQLVGYTEASITVQFSNELCRGIDNDLDKLKVVYDYIINNITYDFPKAANIETGYIPSVDSTYISKTGICFDYSVMLAAMLRTQLIPVKLVMGYLNGTSVYHAWNEVYLRDKGWVTLNIFVDDRVFSMLDTTLAASQSDEAISAKLGNPDIFMPVNRY